MKLSLCGLALISIFLLSCAQVERTKPKLPQRAVQHISQNKFDALRLYVKHGDWIGLTKPQLASALTVHAIPHKFEFQLAKGDERCDEVLWIPFGFDSLVTIGCRNGVVVLADETYIPE